MHLKKDYFCETYFLKNHYSNYKSHINLTNALIDVYLAGVLHHPKTQALTFRAEQSVPALPADALEADVAVAVLAPRQGDATVAPLPVEPQLAEALAGTVAVALQGVAARPAPGHVAQVTRPTRKALYLPVVAAHVVRVLVLGRRDLAGLREGGLGVSRGIRHKSTDTSLDNFLRRSVQILHVFELSFMNYVLMDGLNPITP